MNHDNLQAFLDTLRKEKEIVEISAPVDPYLELAEIHRRVIDDEGPALLFTNVKRSSFPVVTNLFGTNRRVELAFGPRPEQFMKQIVGAMDSLMPPSPKAIWNERSLLMDMLKVGMKNVQAAQAPVLDVYLSEPRLDKLPVLTCWQEDGGPFFTQPLVYTEHPTTKHHNLGMYRMQVYDRKTTGMHWQIHKGGGFHYHEAEKLNQALPVTVFLGGPPALVAAAIAPVPEHLPELLLASLILGKKLKMTNNPQGGHRLIAEAEFALSGVVPPHKRRPEGPFGDHFGYYSLIHDFPEFHIQHMWHRKDAVYPATIVGKPRQEDYYFADFLQKLLSPAFPMAMPGVKSLWAYPETGVHPLAAAVVRESYGREGLTSAFRILGEGQLTLTKFLILTDREVNLENFADLLRTVLERFDPRQDLFIFNETSHDTLDYTGRRFNHGSKAVLMGMGSPLRKLPGAYEGGQLPRIHSVSVYCPGCLVISGDTYAEDPELAQHVLSTSKQQLSAWPMVILADDVDIVKDQTKFLWTVFTRFNPATDMYADAEAKQHHLYYEFPIVIDARMKPDYPDELFPREDIVELVSERWKEYFPS